ncbi:long-chain-fatty-acid--CoA ligase [Candidatus Acetothermia bacterium]|jgi:fatty-acyl-CoA synthase|nr:long-chain-fatty-acid--CoA ligase [Candidatus Acetothermia bacterium]MCI2427092.1 long-chain-fatty-acid--CoA ligase [Candidatus Acetothermia bacterium]MCI2428272.1 long-chain-fatty-acid--CoA ligase [Candidatus Acetothermia bacterium]
MLTLEEILSRTAHAFPDNEAIVLTDQRITYRQLNKMVDHLARGLIEFGVAKGDKVGLWMPNYPEWVVSYFAIARIGAVVVPFNTRYKTHEVQYILEDSEATTLFIVDSFAGIDYRTMINEIRSMLPRLQNIIVLGEAGEKMIPFSNILTLGEQYSGDHKLADRQAILSPEENILILYTSGTTGQPKGAMLSHRNMAENARQVTAVLETSEHDRFFLAVPFFHCFGCVMGILGAITWGAGIVPMPIFKPREALELVEQTGVTILYGVPTMFVLELEEYRKGKKEGKEYDLTTLRTGIMAGAPCPTEVMSAVIEELGCNVCICYGLTEASPVITMTRFTDSVKDRVETVGQALPGIEVKIVDDARNELPIGVAGELACRGYNVMLGYYKMPEKTAEIIDGDGWLYSGDLATIDEDGYVRIVGRKKDMIITGGFNVYPAEIENYLFTHPKVQNVSVIGVPDEVMGEVVMAFIIPKEKTVLTAEEIMDFCSGAIANFKMPRYIQIVNELPMTQSGKVQKYKLRESAAQSLAAGRLVKLPPHKR